MDENNTMQAHEELPRLTPDSFDSIFAPEFFKLPKQQDEKIPPLPFQLPPYDTEKEFANNLKNFLESKEGEEFKKGVKKLADKIAGIISSWPEQDRKQDWIEHLDYFVRKRFTEYFGKDKDANKKIKPLYTDAVIALHGISIKLQDDSLPLVYRQNVMRDLLEKDELERCGPATADFIIDAYMQLLTSPAERLMAIRRKLIKQTVNEVRQKMDTESKSFESILDPHYVSYFLFSYKEELGVTAPWDPHFANLDSEKVKKLFKRLMNILPTTLTFGNVLNELIVQFDLKTVVNDVNKKPEEYNAQTNKLKNALDQCGKDEDWVIGNFFNIDTDNQGNLKNIQLRSSASELLTITLINRLFNAGYLNKEQKIEIPISFTETGLKLLSAKPARISYPSLQPNVIHLYKKDNTIKYVVNNIHGKIHEIEIIEDNIPADLNDPTLKLTLKKELVDFLKSLFDKIPLPEDLYTLSNRNLDKNIIENLKIFFDITFKKGHTPAKDIFYFIFSEKGDLTYFIKENEQCYRRFFPPYYNRLQFGQKNKIFDDVINILIEKLKKAPKSQRKTIAHPLFYLSEKNKDHALYYRLIQEKIILPDDETRNGLTPAIFAVKNGFLDTLQFFSDQMLRQADAAGDQPIHFATYFGYINIVQYLIEKNIDLNAKNLHGSTPLTLAAEQGHSHTTEYLIEKGARINEKNIEGNTSLILAAKKGHFNIVQYLVKKGVSLDDKNTQGNTAFSVTTNSDIRNCLLLAGAKVHPTDKNTISNPLEKEILILFERIPDLEKYFNQENQNRDRYILNLRKRLLEAYKKEENKESRQAVERELNDFIELEKQIEELYRVTTHEKQSIEKKDFECITALVQNVYGLFSDKKNLVDVLQFLTANYRDIIKNPTLFSTPKVSPVLAFFGKKSIKENIKTILISLEKQYPFLKESSGFHLQ